jgi:aspartyl-tRNA(Asn)/glutamyl-tRNA(Gln) amidotransferase subunit B
VDENDDTSVKRIGITRAHLEEDAGKSMHADFHNQSGIDLNRAGTPLLEIVSEPDMRSPEEAVAYLKAIHVLVRYLDICDGNMAEGSFRCDVNVSIRPMGQIELGTRTEMKNINSFRFVDQAIRFEVQRQIELIENGDKVIQQTRLYDSIKQETRPMRSKEEANDYRYFPDPDLLPVVLDDEYIARVKTTLPELPKEKCRRFQEEYKLSLSDARHLTQSRELANYFESVLQHQNSSQVDAKLSANWIMGTLMGALNKANLDISNSPINSETLAQLLSRITDNTISGKIAKTLFEALWAQEGSVDELIEKKGLKQVTDTSAIEEMVTDILAAHPEQVEQFRQGKDKMFGFFVGQIMKASKGKANPKQVNNILKDKLK